MTGPRRTNVEMAQLVTMLEERGPTEVHTEELGREAYPLTAEGARVGNRLAMVDRTMASW